MAVIHRGAGRCRCLGDRWYVPKPISWRPPAEPFTPSNVAPLGVTGPTVRRAAAAGRVGRVVRGVYAAVVPDDPVAAHLQRAIALQLRRPGCVAGGHTAALAWGLAMPHTTAAALEPVAFVVPPAAGRRSHRRPEYTVAVRRLPAEHRARHPSGLVVTTPARTAVDVAAGLALPEALMVLDSAARLALIEAVGQARLRQAYEDPRRLRAAVRPLVEAADLAATRLSAKRLSRYLSLADPRRESALESYSFGMILQFGLPLPELQVRISTRLGDFFPDFLWREAWLIGEADGKGKYQETRDLAWQADRQAAMEDIGYGFVRWDSEQMHNSPWIPLNKVAARLR